MARPWMKFYPKDWISDPKLRACSLGARGLWMEMICIMHEARPYGHLLVASKPPTARSLAILVGADSRQLKGLLAELRAADVFSEENGIILSRRMILDFKRSINGHEAGVLGGNPALLRDKGQSNPRVLDARSQIVSVCDTQPDLLSGVEPEKKSLPKNRGTRLPADWTLPSEWRQEAIAKGLRTGDVDFQEQKFKNYWIAKAGAGAIKIDWRATWRNWILENQNRNGFGQPKLNGHTAPAVKKDPRQFTDDEWLPKLKFYKNTRNWNPDWGPELGASGCLAPARLTDGGRFEPY